MNIGRRVDIHLVRRVLVEQMTLVVKNDPRFLLKLRAIERYRKLKLLGRVVLRCKLLMSELHGG